MRRSLGGGEAQRVDRICDSAFETLQDRWAPVRFSRPVAVVNWMLEDKWVTTNERDATLGYEFTDYHALFEYHAYRLTGGPSGEDRGFAVLRIDDVGGHRSVTVFDHHVNDPAGYDQLLGLALDRAEVFRTDYVHVPFQCQPYIERSWFTRHIFRPSERAYYGHPVSKESPLARAIGELTLDLSDGDLAFA
jgi:hypothetical protein